MIRGMGPFKCYVTHMEVAGSTFPGKNITKVYSATLLALRVGGWGSNFFFSGLPFIFEKCYEGGS